MWRDESVNAEHRTSNVERRTEERSSAFGVGRSAFPALALLVVCAIYVATLLTLHPSVFWSPDEGAKFIQMHSRLASPESAHRPSYAASSLDPRYEFYPSAPIYPQPLWPSGIRCHWPAFFPAISRPFFQAFGVWGLYVIPIAGGILSAALAGVMARRLAPRAAAPAVLMAGLATPLFFHSVLFLEHTLACALGLGALLFGWGASRGSGRQRAASALGALVCLFSALALRDETLVLMGALAFAGAWVFGTDWKSRDLPARVFVPALLSLLFVTGIAALFDSGRAAELAGDASAALAGLKDPALWRALPRHVLHVLVNNPEQSGVPLSPEWAIAGLAGLGLCALSSIMMPQFRFRCWLAGACLVAATSAIGLCVPDRYRAIHGLLLPMPCLVLAWLPPHGEGARPPRAERMLAALLPCFLCFHVLATWLLRRPAGGPEWGLRYAMYAYLLAAVMASVAPARFAQAAGFRRRATGAAMAALLVLLSIGYSVRGVFELQVTKRDLRAFEQEILKVRCPIVTDQWWLAAAVAPAFVRTEFFTLNLGSNLHLWIERFGPRGASFLFVSYDLPPDVAATLRGPTATLTGRCEIQNMTFSRFEVR
jgi:hypothetical protein